MLAVNIGPNDACDLSTSSAPNSPPSTSSALPLGLLWQWVLHGLSHQFYELIYGLLLRLVALWLCTF